MRQTRSEAFNGFVRTIEGAQVEGINCEVEVSPGTWWECTIWPDEYPEYATAAQRATASDAPIAPTAAQVRAEAARRIRQAVADANGGDEYSFEEMLTWPEQTLAVVEYLEDPDPSPEDHPLLASLAAGRNITVADMVALIATKRAAYQVIAQSLLGKQAEILRQDPLPADYRNDSWWAE